MQNNLANEKILNCNKKINMAFLSPLGRTHYSRALMEGNM